jgi:hypothetical protein
VSVVPTKNWQWALLLLVMLPSDGMAQDAGQVRRSVAIHWQRVPLRDALARLERAFDATIFLDRRVDPNGRVSLNIEASNIEDALTPIAAERGLGISRIGPLVYLGPRRAAEQLPGVAAARMEDAASLPGRLGAALRRTTQLTWPRLTEPRRLVTSLLEDAGWNDIEAEKLPHDLWSAGRLPELALAEQLTVLLIGFDLTFEIRPKTFTIVIVPLEKNAAIQHATVAPSQGTPPRADRRAERTKQVYTLRVQEQPVGVVLRELSKRLNWAIDIDKEAIHAAGRTLDVRVSFNVENADQDKLLDELLRPAGLDFRREGEKITSVPQDEPAR